MALKASSEARGAEDRLVSERNRAVLVLIGEHLEAQGYTESASTLQREGGAPLGRFECADNMDLLTIIREFEAFYEMKLGKKPKLVRRTEATDEKAREAKRSRPKPGSKSSNQSASAGGGGGRGCLNLTPAQSNKYAQAAAAAGVSSAPLRHMQQKLGAEDQGASAASIGSNGGETVGFEVSGVAVKSSSDRGGQHPPEESLEDRLLKPLPFSGDPELRTLAQTITRDIYLENPNVRWSDVVSLDGAKRLLKEAVVMPVKYPQLFTGFLSPWQGVLLYGPPGTGKTMLAKAVATECQTTFFNISASSIVSKYRGDSEKLVRVLFELARYHAPSTIFLDEIDSLMGQRGGFDGSNEHEGSRRMKTELLIQMDGLAKSDALVFVLAASNIPWQLDVALLRRLEKRVMVPLPDQPARKEMLRKLLDGRIMSEQSASSGSAEVDMEEVARRTEGFSGADVKLLCKEACMKPLRRILGKLESLDEQRRAAREAPPPAAASRSLRPPQAPVISQEEIQVEIRRDPVTSDDIQEALETTRPSAQKYTDKYLKWESEFGAS
eukprot:CAMPEP_0118986538 /NCGR_PEP_ID=MMETSP1173-20130426/42330_1 /TAXON_ID=1034831 /ORGANISM="Rhizochromulina marina cf, Strain CCMP1243" /LENGTH=552 /DNA_ID=CAMNT_0006937327 /DNA_START=49 /DNA_END=1707 /DNA_ORIENTATION=-